MRPKNIYKGFSLIEATIAIMILGIAAAAVIAPFASGMSVRSVALSRSVAAKLASDLMEEILAVDYSEVMNYDGYEELAGQVMDGDADYSKFSRSVKCRQISEGSDDQDRLQWILITVTVEYDGAQAAVLSRLRGGYESRIER